MPKPDARVIRAMMTARLTGEPTTSAVAEASIRLSPYDPGPPAEPMCDHAEEPCPLSRHESRRLCPRSL